MMASQAKTSMKAQCWQRFSVSPALRRQRLGLCCNLTMFRSYIVCRGLRRYSQEDVTEAPKIAKRRPADRFGIRDVGQSCALEAGTNGFRPVNLLEQARRCRVQRIRRPRSTLNGDAVFWRTRQWGNFATTQDGNVIHKGVATEIDLVAIFRSARVAHAKTMLTKSSIVQLHELPNGLFGQAIYLLINRIVFG